MKKCIAFLGSLLIVFGLKAQTTHPAKKETTKQVAPTSNTSQKPLFLKTATPKTTAPQQSSPVIQQKAVPSGKRR
jgi:hypothetical protein